MTKDGSSILYSVQHTFVFDETKKSDSRPGGTVSEGAP